MANKNRYYQNLKTKQFFLVQKCYCGGETVMHSQLHYGKPTFKILNCFPYKFAVKNKLKFIGYKDPIKGLK